MSRHCRVTATLFVLVFAGAVRSQPPAPLEPANLRGDSAQTRKRLSEAEQKIIGGKAVDAVDDLQRILDEVGDDLVTVDGKQFRPARWVAHQILAKLPADSLGAYQNRIDEPARLLLEDGRRNRDPRPLWQMLDRYFVSRPSDDCLLLLGDLLFERGEFRTAELLWRRLIPDANPDVLYPSSKHDPAMVRARIVLAVIYQGDLNRAMLELAAFRTKHPDASGSIAGKTGPLFHTLQSVLDHPPRFLPEGSDTKSWSSFAGGPNRTGRVVSRIPGYWPDNPTWTQKLSIEGVARVSPVHPPFNYPVIAHGRVYLTDGYRVMSFDLLTGQQSIIEASSRGKLTGPEACDALSVAGDRLFARLGPPAMRPTEDRKNGNTRSANETEVVCYGPAMSALLNEPPLSEIWRLKPPAAEPKAPVAWEGVPVVANGKLWAVLARFEGGRVSHSIVCYNPADSDKAPDRPAWQTEVCDSPLTSRVETRTRHELLTLAGRNVVYCSNNGAIVALDAKLGRRAWGFKYPRSARNFVAANRSVDPSPPVAFGGRVFVAPVDADRVYALDAETGQLAWMSGPTEGASILGVARGRLIVTTTGPVRGIRGLNIRTGSYQEPDGWIQHDGGGLLSYGRGLVTDDAIIWPSQAGLFFLNPDTGLPLSGPNNPLSANLLSGRSKLFGNLAYADGVLVVVGSNTIWAYVSEARRFGVDPRSARDPDRARFEQAVDDAERQFGTNPTSAREALLQTTRSDLPAKYRAWAAARLLLLQAPVEEIGQVPAQLRDAISLELRNEWLIAPSGELITLNSLLARHTGRQPPPRNRPYPTTLAAPRTPLAAPRLPTDACIDRTVRLPPSAAPLWPIAGMATPPQHAFAAVGETVISIALESGAKGVYATPAALTHAADWNGSFIAAGPSVVAVYGSKTEPEWVFHVPDTDPLPDRPGRIAIRGDELPHVTRLSSFVLAGSWLFARLGVNHLVAFDLKGRRVAWVLGSHGRSRFEPCGNSLTPRFEPHFLVLGQLIVAQLSNGRRWTVRANTGHVLNRTGEAVRGVISPDFGDATSRAPWIHPPVELGSNRIALSDGPRLVRFYSLTAGRVNGVYVAEGDSSVTGDPPQIRIWDDAVLVSIRRNYGVEIDRIELTDGKSVWPDGPVFVDVDRIDLQACDADSERVYIPKPGRLTAYSLEDAKLAWEAELPDTNGAGGWTVRAGRKVVIVYPQQAIPNEPVATVQDRLTRSFRRSPEVWRLPGLANNLYDAWVERTAPVLLFDPATGRLLKKFAIPARGPIVTAWFEGDLAVLATGDRLVRWK